MALVSKHRRQIGSNLRFRTPGERDLSETFRHPVSRPSHRPQCLDLGPVLADSKPIEHRRRRHERRPREPLLESEQKAASRPVADGHPLPVADDPGHDVERIVRLGPRDHICGGLGCDPRCFQLRDDQVSGVSRSHHQHCQALGVHGLVADQVGQLRTDREQHHRDAFLGHDGARSLHSVGEGTHRRPMVTGTASDRDDSMASLAW